MLGCFWSFVQLFFCLCNVEAVDSNVYNTPSSIELAAIIPGRFAYGDQLDANHFVRDIILCPATGGLERIDGRHQLYDPLHFVFAFPNGELGWRPFIMR